jgi:hypothetical protein
MLREAELPDEFHEKVERHGGQAAAARQSRNPQTEDGQGEARGRGVTFHRNSGKGRRRIVFEKEVRSAPVRSPLRLSLNKTTSPQK